MEKLALDLLREVATIGGFGWVVAVVVTIALVVRDRQYDECRKAQIELAKSLATVLERASTTNAAVAAALESRTGVFEKLVERTGTLISGVEALNGKVDRNGDEVGKVADSINDMRVEAARRGGML